MPTGTAEVETFLLTLDHPMKTSVERLRHVFLGAVPGLSEHIKWNAPSFVHDGTDRVTFRLHPKGALQLILHRGAKVRTDAADFVFADNTGLVTWPTPDRGVITLDDLDAAVEHESDLLDLVQRWVVAQ